MNGRSVLTALRLAFLAGALLVTSLTLLPKKSEAIKCNVGCGTSGPLACNYPCRRTE
ncbi:MAG TPA: hypothetical protein VMM92_11520 [Thermoanaerobaculia bacterium]|nr:hypothetical protein [Thermoanaerobaculia bacterium]